LGVTLLVAGAAVALAGCELIASVDRSKIDSGPGASTGGSENAGGSENTGGEAGDGNSQGGASGGGGGAAGSDSMGGTGGGLVNTCPMDGLGGAPGTPGIPEIAGNYFSGTDASNTFEVPESIGNEYWTQGASDPHVFHYASVDNADNILIAQNGEGNFFFGCLWSRFVWHETNGTLYFCQDVFDAESYADAVSAANGADISDLDAGCLGAGWYRLVPE
jgi:hypothetical protein